MKNVLGIACIVLCMSSLAQAEIYKWVDRNGTTHFSDTLTGVPAEYRQHLGEKGELGIPPGSTDSAPPPVPRPQREEPRGARTLEPPSHVVPLQRDGHGLVVSAVVNGTVTLPLLVDTGASYTVLSTAAARQLALNLHDAAVMPMRSASGVFLAPLTKVKSLSLGNAIVRDMEVIIHDAVPGLGGLLGMSFLEHFIVTTADQTMTLTAPAEEPGTPVYGGYGKNWWVRKFRFYRQGVENMKEYLAQQSSPQLERTLRYFQTELNALDRKASEAAVPRQWRY